MRIKQLKLIVHFLKQLENEIKHQNKQELHSFFTGFFTKEELIEILECSFFDQDLIEHEVETLSEEQLLELIGDDVFIVMFLIQKLESEITASPELKEKKVTEFFREKSLELHYLFSKPVLQWDKYDVANYHSLLARHGKSTCVFAIFTSDITDEQKYLVTTPPTCFFDTKEEAQAELERIAQKRNIPKTEFVIHPLWRVTKN